MREFKDIKVAVAGTGYVGLSIAILLSQHHNVTAVDVIPEKVEKLNKRISPIQDEYIEKYLAEKQLNLTATLDGKAAYADADFVVIAAPTNYDPVKNYFDTSHVEEVIDLVLEVNPNAVMVIKSTIPVGYTRSLYLKYAQRGVKKFNLLFSPEFLRESKALYDNLYPSRIIVGYPKLIDHPEMHEGNKAIESIADIEMLEEAAHTFADLLLEGAIGHHGDTKQMDSSLFTLHSSLSYLGIPYSDIIRKWWAMYNDGCEPVKNNRNTLTFELAVNLRHICGFDRQLLDSIIPCYDGFPEAEKLACIDSALGEKRTQMPKRLKDVLLAIRQERLMDADGNQAETDGLDEALAKDDLFYYNSLPKMPMGVKDSIEAVGPQLALPAITAICPAIGMLATGVKVDVHGKMNSLNLISYIAGDFASGKGSIDPVIDAWTSEVKAMDKMYQQ